MYCTFKQSAKLNCNLDELAKLRMSSMSWKNMNCKFGELDKLNSKFNELDELGCELDKLAKLSRKSINAHHFLMPMNYTLN